MNLPIQARQLSYAEECIDSTFDMYILLILLSISGSVVSAHHGSCFHRANHLHVIRKSFGVMFYGGMGFYCELELGCQETIEPRHFPSGVESFVLPSSCRGSRHQCSKQGVCSLYSRVMHLLASRPKGSVSDLVLGSHLLC